MSSRVKCSDCGDFGGFVGGPHSTPCRSEDHIVPLVQSSLSHLSSLMLIPHNWNDEDVWSYTLTPNRPQSCVSYETTKATLLSHGLVLDAKPPNEHGVIHHIWTATPAVVDAFTKNYPPHVFSSTRNKYVLLSDSTPEDRMKYRVPSHFPSGKRCTSS